MKKKTISLLMAASLAASSLAGGIVSFAEESDPITLSVWAPFTGSDGDVLREIIDNYNETNTDNITVQIDIMDNATLQSKLPTAVSTGTGPSFVLVGIEFLQQYAKNGLIEDISDFWDVTGIDKSNFYENVLAKSYVGDTQYGVPMQYNLQYLYYNKDIFEAAGLDPETPPTTLDELKEDAIACTDASKNQYGIGIPYDYASYCEYLWANGGDVISTDGKENLLKFSGKYRHTYLAAGSGNQRRSISGRPYSCRCRYNVPGRPAGDVHERTVEHQWSEPARCQLWNHGDSGRQCRCILSGRRMLIYADQGSRRCDAGSSLQIHGILAV